MRRGVRILCSLAVLGMVAGLASEAYARALVIYPLQGQSAQQQEDDRSDCADFAAQTSGYNPSGLPMIVRPGAPGPISGPVVQPPVVAITPNGPVVGSAPPPPGLIGGVINRRQAAVLDQLYANYLAAGATCLTARGYQVSM